MQTLVPAMWKSTDLMSAKLSLLWQPHTPQTTGKRLQSARMSTLTECTLGEPTCLVPCALQHVCALSVSYHVCARPLPQSKQVVNVDHAVIVHLQSLDMGHWTAWISSQSCVYLCTYVLKHV